MCSGLQFDILEQKKARCGNKVSEMISCRVSGVDATEVLKCGAYLSFEGMRRRIKHVLESERPVHYEGTALNHMGPGFG